MRSALNQAVALAKKSGYIFFVTADKKAVPHMTMAKLVQLKSRDHITLIGWFCQNTLSNLQENPKVSIVIWDPSRDQGYQLEGRIENIREVAELDGYAAGVEDKKHFPQVEWEVVICVEDVLNFQKAPHMDVEV